MRRPGAARRRSRRRRPRSRPARCAATRGCGAARPGRAAPSSGEHSEHHDQRGTAAGRPASAAPGEQAGERHREDQVAGHPERGDSAGREDSSTGAAPRHRQRGRAARAGPQPEADRGQPSSMPPTTLLWVSAAGQRACRSSGAGRCRPSSSCRDCWAGPSSSQRPARDRQPRRPPPPHPPSATQRGRAAAATPGSTGRATSDQMTSAWRRAGSARSGGCSPSSGDRGGVAGPARPARTAQRRDQQQGGEHGEQVTKAYGRASWA